MSEKYPSDVKVDENADGTVSFATDVVATIAGLAANEVEGVASMPSTSGGIADILSRKSSRNFTKGVRIDIDGNKVAVDVTIIVEYGSPVPDVARSIQENVKKAIETMSGLDVRNVDVHVTGISFEREQRANAELDEQHRRMLEETEEAEAESAAGSGDDTVIEVKEVVTDDEAPFDEEEEEALDDLDEEDDLDLEDEDDEDEEEDEEDEDLGEADYARG